MISICFIGEEIPVKFQEKVSGFSVVHIKTAPEAEMVFRKNPKTIFFNSTPAWSDARNIFIGFT